MKKHLPWSRGGIRSVLLIKLYFYWLEYINQNDRIRIHDRQNTPWFSVQQAVLEPKSSGQHPVQATDALIVLGQ